MINKCRMCQYSFDRCNETWSPNKCLHCPRGGKNPGDPHCLCLAQGPKECKSFRLEWRFWKWLKKR